MTPERVKELASEFARFNPMGVEDLIEKATQEEREAIINEIRDAGRMKGELLPIEDLFDNMNGLGQVPDGRDVDYFGFQITMTPDEFLTQSPLIDPIPKNLAYIKAHMTLGGTLGSPFVKPEWSGDLDKWIIGISDHEGRHRMAVIKELYGGDVEIPVHVLPQHDLWGRDINDAMREAEIITEAQAAKQLRDE